VSLKTTKATYHGRVTIEESEVTVVLRALPEDEGSPDNPFDCRLAKAAERAFPGGKHMIGKTFSIIEIAPGRPVRFKNGRDTREAIHEFDDTGVMPDGTYTFLPVPDPQTLERVREKLTHKREMDRASGRKHEVTVPGEPHKDGPGMSRRGGVVASRLMFDVISAWLARGANPA
jgi:hypothetical protein